MIAVDIMGALISVATGPDAEINPLDMLVHVTTSRMALEEYWIPEVLGPVGEPILPIDKLGEDEIWEISRAVLTPQQEGDLGGLIEHWRAQHPSRRSLLGARFSRFTSEFSADDQALALALIHDVQGIRSEARELRLTAERTLFLAHHLPWQVQSQAQLQMYDFLLNSQTQKVLEGYDAIARSAEPIGRTVDALPAELERQRREALAEFWTGLASEREAVMQDLVAYE